MEKINGIKHVALIVLFWIVYSSSVLLISETKLSNYFDWMKVLRIGFLSTLTYILSILLNVTFTKMYVAFRRKMERRKKKSFVKKQEIKEKVILPKAEKKHAPAPLAVNQGSLPITPVRDVD